MYFCTNTVETHILFRIREYLVQHQISCSVPDFSQNGLESCSAANSEKTHIIWDCSFARFMGC